MNEQDILTTLNTVGAVITGSHIVYQSGKHGTAYINKDAVYPHTKETSRLCRAIAEHFSEAGVEVVVAPAVGGVLLSQWTAFHLSAMSGKEVLSTYAEHDESLVLEARGSVTIELPEGTFDRENEPGEITLSAGEQLIIRKRSFVIKRGYDKNVAGKRVLVVDDVLTTGGSVKAVVEATRNFGGKIVGLAVLCNRGGVMPQSVGNVPELFALVSVTLDAWEALDCPLCKQNVPINTDVGHGRQFLASRKQ